jgi:hypothetical protein
MRRKKRGKIRPAGTISREVMGLGQLQVAFQRCYASALQLLAQVEVQRCVWVRRAALRKGRFPVPCAPPGPLDI